MSRKWGPMKSLLFLTTSTLMVTTLTWKLHYKLPTPVAYQYNPVTGQPQLSETAILEYSRQLSEDIGYRTVGTSEHAEADQWIQDIASKMENLCSTRAAAAPSRGLECEVWHQVGSGSHRFDMMGQRLYKTYANLTNLVIRVSNGTPEGKEHAVLVNAHLDSTIPSPGAADDAMSVGVMLECLRVLVETPEWSPQHAIIFLFNHAEESLQDGSHLFSTQHPVAKTVRAAINLEAAGTTGPTLLFQATSEAMIKAYSTVPYPYGNTLANEIFSSGIVLSDTDFRQFELYLDVTGLDMAVVGNSYLYHTSKYIEPGAAQHMAENTLVLLKTLSSKESPLPSLTLNEVKTAPRPIFFSLLGRVFLMYSTSTAWTLSFALFTISMGMGILLPPYLSAGELMKALGAISAAFIGALVGSNVVAVLMVHVLGRGLSWFTSEFAPVLLFGPAAMGGALISQLLLPYHRPNEQAYILSSIILQSFLAWCIQGAFNLGSAQLFFISAISQFVGLIYNMSVRQSEINVRLSSYAIGQILCLVVGVESMMGTLDFFVPLTGRIGEEAPAEHIIATLVAFFGAYSLPTTLPFFARFRKAVLIRAILFVTVVQAFSIAYFSGRKPFDYMHPRRVFMLHTQDVARGTNHLHVASADGAPGFEKIVDSIAEEFSRIHSSSIPAEKRTDVLNGDWDLLYPFSAFMTTYRIPLPVNPAYNSPWGNSSATSSQFRVEVIKQSIDESKRTRKLELVIHHPNLIWTVIAFNAQVLSWSLDGSPPTDLSRHYLKEGSFYGISSYPFSLEVVDEGPLSFDFVGLREDAVYPAKKQHNLKKRFEEGDDVMVTLENLHGFLEEKYEGELDTLLMGAVAGVVLV